MNLRVLVADDHPLMRAGIRSLLETIAPDATILEATDGKEAIEIASRARADVVLMDITMPGLNGVDAVRRLATERPECKIIMLSMHRDEDHVARAVRAGAVGYLTKDSAVAEIPEAIQAVMRGEVFISRSVPTTAARLLSSATAADSPLDLLSTRQREILQLIAEGHSTKEIGYRLGLSVKTVETHRRILMNRLDIHDVAGLARLAVRTGLVSAER